MDILRLCRNHYERLPSFNLQKRLRSRICWTGQEEQEEEEEGSRPHVLDMGSPELSELGDTASFRDEPIHIEFSAKEPSAEDRRFADVIRFVPVKEYQVSPGTSQAIRKVQEFEDDEYSV